MLFYSKWDFSNLFKYFVIPNQFFTSSTHANFGSLL
jgi:hypothetical protein